MAQNANREIGLPGFGLRRGFVQKLVQCLENRRQDAGATDSIRELAEAIRAEN